MFVLSLPRYDHPSTRERLDAVYAVVRQELAQVGNETLPKHLNRTTPLADQWADSSLILSQCCGPDLQSVTGQGLQAVARPVFKTLDCEPGLYFSYIVARSPDVSESPVIAINSPTSYSGCLSLLTWLTNAGLGYSQCRVSGSHQQSINIVKAGGAELAAIDAYAWQFLDHSGLTILGCGETAPSPPFVKHRETKIDNLLLVDALEVAYKEHGEALGLTQLLLTDNELYRSWKQTGEVDVVTQDHIDSPPKRSFAQRSTSSVK